MYKILSSVSLVAFALLSIVVSFSSNASLINTYRINNQGQVFDFDDTVIDATSYNGFRYALYENGDLFSSTRGRFNLDAQINGSILGIDSWFSDILIYTATNTYRMQNTGNLFGFDNRVRAAASGRDFRYNLTSDGLIFSSSVGIIDIRNQVNGTIQKIAARNNDLLVFTETDTYRMQNNGNLFDFDDNVIDAATTSNFNYAAYSDNTIFSSSRGSFSSNLIEGDIASIGAWGEDILVFTKTANVSAPHLSFLFGLALISLYLRKKPD